MYIKIYRIYIKSYQQLFLYTQQPRGGDIIIRFSVVVNQNFKTLNLVSEGQIDIYKNMLLQINTYTYIHFLQNSLSFASVNLLANSLFSNLRQNSLDSQLVHKLFVFQLTSQLSRQLCTKKPSQKFLFIFYSHCFIMFTEYLLVLKQKLKCKKSEYILLTIVIV
ncbi:hypothetical protein ABPG72_005048 [Tetrahymena utriculariae]